MKHVRGLKTGIGSVVLAAVLLGTAICAPLSGTSAEAAAGRTLKMSTARALAVEESSAYFQVEETISSKQAALESARKAIKLKQKNMSTFRWTPLLSFKFPTKPDEGQAFEFQFKCVSIQAEIDEAIHKLNDTKIAIYQEINELYVQIVVLQKTIAFNQERLAALDEGIAKNKARLSTGDATQADVDKLTKKRESTVTKIAADKRTLEADLKKLSKKLGTNVESGYQFETPFIEARIERRMLPALIQYTLDNDQAYYEACMNETTARISLNTNYKLMKQHYGGDINMISGYVQQSLNGEKLNARAFKNDYKTFVEKIDSYWQGKKRILFIKIPRLWFKGSLDGARYIENDPYVLYQDALDYGDAHTERLDAASQLEDQVTDSFENYVSIKNSYEACLKDLDKARESLDASQVLNRLGQLSFEEYNSEMDDYEELQNSLFDIMKTYSETLYAFDRLTCGGVTALLSGTDANLSTGISGQSYVVKEGATGAQYFIQPIIQDEAFEFSIYVPDDFEVGITHYELWCDGLMIGERTETAGRIRHLGLAVDEVKEAKVRLYDGDTFVGDAVIDATASTGPLPIVSERRIVKAGADDLGVYELTTNPTTGLVSLKLQVTEDDAVKFYQIKSADGIVMTGEKPVAVDTEFVYLGLLENSLSELDLVLMDESEAVLYEARFDTTSRKIKKKITEE